LPKILAPPLVLPLVEVLVELELDVELFEDPVVVVPPVAVVDVVSDAAVVLDPAVSVAWVDPVACIVVELASPDTELLVEAVSEVCGEDSSSPPHPAIAKVRAMTTTVAVRTSSNLLRDIDLAVIGSLGSCV
jgi:hypothetical protein